MRFTSSIFGSIVLSRFASFSSRGTAFSAEARSASTSSSLIVSTSERGSTLPSTWITLSSVKKRTTSAMASVSRMFARNWLPRPAPSLAPLTRPAMSTNSTVAGNTRCGFAISDRRSSRSSGTGTIPTLGSMVANG